MATRRVGAQQRECGICHKSFAAFPSSIRRGGGKYCSVACRGAAMKGAGNHKWGTGADVFARVMARTVVGGPNECWNFEGAVATKAGHRHVNDGGKQVSAHRVAWEHAHGPIPDGLNVLHTCDNPACVNPAHLFLGTHVDNVADKVSKGRQARGETQHTAKLTEADVREIRRRFSAGESRRALAKRFGVVYSTVSGIISGRGWRHVR